MRWAIGLAAAAMLAGCDAAQPPPADRDARSDVPSLVPSPTGTAHDSAGGRAPADGTARPLATDDWIGRWTGPEGLFLDIVPGGERGRYAITIRGDLDGAGDRVNGMAEGDTIRFVRGTTVETLRATDGAGTGLKWLAGKRHCLTVKPGEGFCRE